jgi:hypothetical protein
VVKPGRNFNEALVVRLVSMWSGAILNANVTLLDGDSICSKLTGIQTYRTGLGIEDINTDYFRLFVESPGGMPVDRLQSAFEWRILQAPPTRLLFSKLVPAVDQRTFRFDFDMMDADAAEKDPSRLFRVVLQEPGAFCRWDGTSLVVSGPTGSDRFAVLLFLKTTSMDSVPSSFRILCPYPESGVVAGLQYAYSAKAAYYTSTDGGELCILVERKESERKLDLERYYTCWNSSDAEYSDLRLEILEKAKNREP